MSVNLEAKITVNGLKHYHDSIVTEALEPIYDRLFENATEEDIASIFGPTGSKVTVKGIDLQANTVTVIDSEGNSHEMDSSGSYVLDSGQYNIVISRDDNTANSSFVAEFDTSQQDTISINNPVLITKFNAAETNAEGMYTAMHKLFDGGKIAGSSMTYISYSKGTEITFTTQRKMLLKRVASVIYSNGDSSVYIDSRYPEEYSNSFYYKYYGSNDGENWTAIGPEVPLLSVYLSDMFSVVFPYFDSTRNTAGVQSFEDSNNKGYTHHKLVVEGLGTPRSKMLYGIGLIEAYWMN